MAETSEQSFIGTMSTNEIWRGNDTSRCLTDDLNAMDTIHESLPNTYAAKNHTHSGYAAKKPHSQLSTFKRRHTHRKCHNKQRH